MYESINFIKISPGGMSILRQLEGYIKQCGLEPSLVELVRLRTSQINGCAYCIDMHTKDAREAGESEQRLYGLSAWRISSFYSERERAALAWTEAVTKISEAHITDEIYQQVRQQFDDKELVDLTFVVIAINSWNRLAIPFHTPPGTYKPESPVAQRRVPDGVRT